MSLLLKSLKSPKALLVLFVLGTLVRMIHIAEPPLDFHPVRQYIGASVTRAYYAQMGGIEDPLLKETAIVTLERQELFEPQILPGLSALVWKMAGNEVLWFQRVFSVIAWLLGGIALQRIARRFWNLEYANLTFLVFAFMPFSIICSRVIQPDPFMVALMLWAMERTYAYWERPSGRRLAVVFVFAAASVMVKPMSIFMIWALFASKPFFEGGIRAVVRNSGLWGLTLVMVAPNVLWYLNAHSKNSIVADQGEMSFLFKIFIDPYYYANWLKMVGRNIGFLPGLLILWMSVKAQGQDFRRFVQAFVFSYFCYAIVFHYHIATHGYYSIMLIPLAAVACAGGLKEWLSFYRSGHFQPMSLKKTIPIVLVLCLFYSAFVATRGGTRTSVSLKAGIEALALNVGVSKKIYLWVSQTSEKNNQAVTLLEKIGETVNHSSRVWMLTDDFSKTLIFHGQMEGYVWLSHERILMKEYREGSEVDKIAYFEEQQAIRNCEYFVVTKMDELEKSADLLDFLRENYSVVELDSEALIFDLRVNSEKQVASHDR
ncbi:glycosyltransferase family 39 protein [bacterium]|nr:glycosyltransferase family 39 protein [bacterium]